MAALFGADDHRAKHSSKRVNWSGKLPAFVWAVRTVAPRGSPHKRLDRLLAIKGEGEVTRALMQARCDRGAEIAHLLGFEAPTAEAIRALDEHWDGHGRPRGLRADAIPLLSRIMCLAQSVEVFHAVGGRPAAYAMARRRRGRWFDPQLVDVLGELLDDATSWRVLDASPAELEREVARHEPRDLVRVASAAEVDRVVAAFARIVDAKSHYTYQHSERVAVLCVRLGHALGMRSADLAGLRRAALLHDLGKLALPNRILDRPGPLTDDEFALVREHPRHSERILARVPVLSSLGAIAGAHHERLDGSGYPDGLTGEQLDLPARILATADVYEALTAERPYRPALSASEALRVIGEEAGRRLCPNAVGALEKVAAQAL